MSAESTPQDDTNISKNSAHILATARALVASITCSTKFKQGCDAEESRLFSIATAAMKWAAWKTAYLAMMPPTELLPNWKEHAEAHHAIWIELKAAESEILLQINGAGQ